MGGRYGRNGPAVRSAKEKEFTGSRFGRLVTLYPVVRTHQHLGGWWLCQCDCGKEVDVEYRNLIAGLTVSCGCKRKRRILAGRKFNRLTVVRFKVYRWAKNGTRISFYLCRCDCGAHATIRGTSLLQGHTKSCGCLRIEKSTARLKGLRHDSRRDQG